MNKQFATALLLLALGTGAAPLANAQMAAQPKADQKPTFSAVFDRSVSRVENQTVEAADAMPEDKFNFAPAANLGAFKDVRTFAQQVKHIATANYALGAAVIGEKPPLDLKGENGPDNITSKADIMKYLKDSFAYAHKAAQSVTDANLLEMVQSPFGPNQIPRLALVTGMIAHPFDHYGQMVVYLRMNGIIPPASRPSK